MNHMDYQQVHFRLKELSEEFALYTKELAMKGKISS